MAVIRPTVLPQWASEDVQDSVTGQFNVVEPPLEVKQEGWFSLEKPNRQWWNWFQRQCYLWIQWMSEQPISVTTTATGLLLFPYDNALITIDAIDTTTAANYLRAIGFKGPGVAPVFPIGAIQANGLSLAAGNSAGDQPITGGTNVIVTGRSSLIYL